MSDGQRLRWVAWIAIGACLAGMALCPRLWIAERSFPVLPVGDLLRAPASVHLAMSIGLIVSLLGAGAWPARRWITLCACVLFVGLVMLDQSRLQPWIYLYVMVLAVIACRRPGSDDAAAVGTLRVLFAFVYGFSALHKLNASFFLATGPAILSPLAQLLPTSWPVGALAYPMPAVELALGPLLTFRRTRRWGIALAAGMHATILLLIGPLGLDYNSVVWPWNVAMATLVWVLFRDGREEPAHAPTTTGKPSRPCMAARIATIAVAGVLPLAGVLGRLDRYITWNLYGAEAAMMAVWFNDAVKARLPEHLRPHVQTLVPGENGILISDWSMNDLNVGYPEVHLMRRAAATLEAYIQRQGEATLEITYEPEWSTAEHRSVTTPIVPKGR